MDSNFFAFVLVVIAVVVSPGPDSILILKNTLVSGRWSGTCTLLGVQAGVASHALLSVIGLSAVLYYSPTVFRALALVGALYLAYIGYLTAKQGITGASLNDAKQIPPRRAFMQGMLCNLLNPKVIILFVVLMPTFVDHQKDNIQQQLIILASTLLAINIPFQFLLVTLAAQMNRWLKSPRKAQVLQYSLAALLVFFALVLFAEHVLLYTKSAL
ncbi:MAG: LysE family translocator [Proteobacteria bacterium]|nr:LysE family translocator [Pseudomonadota bacterium]